MEQLGNSTSPVPGGVVREASAPEQLVLVWGGADVSPAVGVLTSLGLITVVVDPHETPEAGARRELEEETGLRAGALQPLSVFYTTPGFCDEVMHLFRATGLSQGEARPEEDERIEVRSVPLETARDMIQRGEIREGKTLVALLLELDRRRSARA